MKAALNRNIVYFYLQIQIIIFVSLLINKRRIAMKKLKKL